MKNSAGALRERVELLGLTETAGGWEYIKYAEVWAAVELTGKTSLFSKIGIGARAAELTLRRRALTLHQAARWRGQHLFLSEITEPARGWLSVQAAVVEVTECTARHREAAVDKSRGNRPVRTVGPPFAFPGVLTEKYVRYEREATHAAAGAGLVLVAPKPVALDEGDFVDALGARHYVTAVHSLDPWKNEYEIERREDV
ncbi:hypothetical protein [Lawsonibacter faecis]|uniref:Uncharacterized protein n=1 Tax=Lawsonibacter faecis TaxID=2763052 RepID=A0A8J6JKW9_9FIRM|nr:hypothetical protein [Lawsonibacter faecis]MBC5736080.1 hypothetical protein [Lawsonibacter faecis]